MIVLLWTACTAGGGHHASVATSGTDTADADTAAEQDTGEHDTGDTGDTGVPRASCPDGPWQSVQLAWRAACGLHEDGCLECWGDDRWYWETDNLFVPPDIVATSFTMIHNWGRDTEADWPSGCALDAEGGAHCWGRNSTWLDQGIGSERLTGVARTDNGETYLLDSTGALWAANDHAATLPVSGTIGPLLAGRGFGVATVGGAELFAFSMRWDELSLTSLGFDWRQYSTSFDVVVGIRVDGAVIRVDPNTLGVDELAPAGGAWVAVYGDLVVDADGWVYDVGATDAGPYFGEPMKEVAQFGGDGACGVTFDGRLECTGTYHDTYPPPGSFVVPD